MHGHESHELIDRGCRDHLLRLGQQADELDLEVLALDFLRGLGEHVLLHHQVPRPVDHRNEHFVVQALQHRAEEDQLLFFLGRDLAGCDLATVGVHQELEQVVVEALLDLDLEVLQSRHDALRVGPDVHDRVDRLVGTAHVVDVLRAGEQGQTLRAAGAGHRRVHQLLQGLELAPLHSLHLQHVAQDIHAGAVTVDVVARHVPAGTEARELPESALGQEVRVLQAARDVLAALAGFEVIDRRPRHVLAVQLAGVAVAAGIDRMHHDEPVNGHPGRVVVNALHDFGQSIVSEAADKLPGRHGAGAENRVDPAVLVDVEDILANSQGVETNPGLLVFKLEHEARAESPELPVDRVDHVVEIGAVEDGPHAVLAVVEPGSNRLELGQVLILQGQPEPRAGRGRHAPVHAGGQVAHSQDARGAQDVLPQATPVRDVALELQGAHLARQEMLGQELPIGLPCPSLLRQRLAPVRQFLHIHHGFLLLAQELLSSGRIRGRAQGAGQDRALLA